MDEVRIYEFASSLLSAHGDAAEAEAAQKAREYDERGEAQLAEDWRRIRKAISALRGPGVS